MEYMAANKLSWNEQLKLFNELREANNKELVRDIKNKLFYCYIEKLEIFLKKNICLVEDDFEDTFQDCSIKLLELLVIYSNLKLKNNNTKFWTYAEVSLKNFLKDKLKKHSKLEIKESKLKKELSNDEKNIISNVETDYKLSEEEVYIPLTPLENYIFFSNKSCRNLSVELNISKSTVANMTKKIITKIKNIPEFKQLIGGENE